MNKTNQDVADFEQIETDIISTARAIAGYHNELVKGHLPPALIAQLTLDFSRQWWTSQLGLHEQHVYMHNDTDFIEGEE